MCPDEVIPVEFIENEPVMKDGELIIRIREKNPPDYEKGFSPFYRFVMLNEASGEEMGFLSLRVGYTHNDVNYRGNIGFTVNENFRGRNYAARSCKLIIPVIKYHSLKHLWLTCNEDNIASRKAIEKTGAVFVEKVNIPEDYGYAWYYPPDSRKKLRFKWIIE